MMVTHIKTKLQNFEMHWS